jgi:ATP-dependent DNA helicase DinG
VERDYLTQVFGEGGLFARKIPGYERRDGQVALAHAIDRGMREGIPVLAEGPCGTGKSFAYGVPAVYHAAKLGKRVVIATANIALQEQLVHSDLPRLAAVLPWEFSFALLKGRSNYLCIDRLHEEQPLAFAAEEGRQMREIAAWSRATTAGDSAELPFQLLPQVWGRFAVGPFECKRDGCRYQGDCFADRARAIAADADIVVTNYHLLFAHLAVRRSTGRDLVLPPFDLLVCDEAHEAADIAREFLGFTVGSYSLSQLAHYAFELGLSSLAEPMRVLGDQFFLAAAGYAKSGLYEVRLQTPGFVGVAELVTAVRKFEAAAAALDSAGEEKETRAVARNAARLAKLAATQLEEAVAQSDPNKAYWIEVDKRGRALLHARPIDVSGVLRDELFGRTGAVTLTSATLATEGNFGFARRELGVPTEAIEALVESPFDFSEQARLIIPQALPDPGEEAFVDAVAAAFQSVVDQCDGRTLGLFASHQSLTAVHERITRIPQKHRVLRQGEAPRAELMRIFKEDLHSVLLGTNSFRTGLDVPGEALTGLVIDKLPFPSPTDPLVHAIHSRDPRAFWVYSLPKAIIALRQAVGRLIRTQSDVGIVVILDGRLHYKRYRDLVLRSLPPMPRGSDLGSIRAFLAARGRTRRRTPKA